MITSVTQTEYTGMRSYINDVCGLTLPADGDFLIRKNLSGLADEHGRDSFEALLELLKRDKDDILRDRVTSALLSHETGWFRDKQCWDYIKEVVVPSLLAKGAYGEHPRVLSIGVSTGQEAYSLAITITEAVNQLTDRSAADKIEIIGTDVSASALFLATTARYDVLSIGKGLGPDMQGRYFKSTGRTWALKPDISKKVSFRRFNPVDGFASLGSFDLILFRDMLEQYSESMQKTLVKYLSDALRKGGVLLTGRSRVDQFNLPALKDGEYGGFQFFRKN